MIAEIPFESKRPWAGDDTMTKTRHTPGPWTMTRMSSGNTRISFELEAKNGYVVAYIDDSNSDNARLIAAAPELLDALRVIVLDPANAAAIDPMALAQAQSVIANAIERDRNE